MPATRHNPDGSITEQPPAVLDCGHPYGPGLVVLGYNPHPSGAGRARSYYCRACRVTTYSEPDRRLAVLSRDVGYGITVQVPIQRDGGTGGGLTREPGDLPPSAACGRS